jgi:hypothetical protein
MSILRTLVLVFGDSGFDENRVLQDSTLVSFLSDAANCLYQAVSTAYITFYTPSGGANVPNHGFEMKFYLTSTGDTTFQSNVASFAVSVGYPNYATYFINI